MRKKIPWQATGLLVGAGLVVFAGGPGESVAQTRAETERERLSLSAAIEEARRSPFYTGTTGTETWKGRAHDTGTDGTATTRLFQPGLQEKHPMSAPSFVSTLVLAELSHLAAAYLFWSCALDERSRSAAGCFLGPVLPLPVVALPALLSGADPGRTLAASGIGLLGGAATYLLSLIITEQISNASIFGSALPSGLAHAVITAALLRPR